MNFSALTIMAGFRVYGLGCRYILCGSDVPQYSGSPASCSMHRLSSKVLPSLPRALPSPPRLSPSSPRVAPLPPPGTPWFCPRSLEPLKFWSWSLRTPLQCYLSPQALNLVPQWMGGERARVLVNKAIDIVPQVVSRAVMSASSAVALPSVSMIGDGMRVLPGLAFGHITITIDLSLVQILSILRSGSQPAGNAG
ncbi:hypothetical protein BD779DRAFT_283588 [Infundibulicybe gibba]|nr:hypothetical protein BD779DRAFT_283588 [Infundibulicybe gibba]